MRSAPFASIVLTLLACIPGAPTSLGESSATHGTSDTSVATGDVPTTSGGASGASDPDPTHGHTFLSPPDGGAWHCDLLAQDCPAGQKCNPLNVHHEDVNAGEALCVPVVRAPGPPGSACSVLGDAEDGTDDCALGSVCLFPDDRGGGECHALCDLGGDDPVCTPAGTQCTSRGCQDCTWGYCDRPCDPRAPDGCEPGRLCLPWWDQKFACGPDASGVEGQAGDPCEFANGCDPGLLCAAAEQVPDCVGSPGCCSPFCSTDQANTCPNKAQGEVCVPWFVDEQPPPELANLGVCALPP